MPSLVRNKLSAIRVSRLIAAGAPGAWNDGGGLYLIVRSSTAAKWVYRYHLYGRKHDAGLGSARDVSLARARELAAEMRALRAEGVDPIETRNVRRLQEHAKAMTFQECARVYVAERHDTWHKRHAQAWLNTFRDHAFPLVGEHFIGAIGTAEVLKVLRPIWATVPVTATRVRSRLESVLDYATAHGYRSGPNPAKWRGHLDKLLPRQGKEVRHHPAIPFAELPSLMSRLREMDTDLARALRFLILTCARTSEVLGMTWAEIDPEGRQWQVPAGRMKARRPHRVPLSEAAMSALPIGEAPGLVFPSDRGGQRGAVTFARILQGIRPGVTPHGFRSAFRSWAAETGVPRELAELALAHRVEGATERAYLRTDMIERRRELAETWARAIGG